MFMHFNPRPREEGDILRCVQRSHGFYFNPRPREEGDQVLNASWDKIFISIHALVKRATAGAHTGTVADVDFNPRPREEGDDI